jgi:iron complex outermembrane recepter protein
LFKSIRLQARRLGQTTAGLAVAASLTLTAGAPAFAAEAEGGGGLEEVVVTARKTEESLQTTPVSIVAVSGDQLTALGVDSLKNFDVTVPNLSIGGTMGQGNSVANFSIRGVGGASSGFITQESAVGVYIDDVLYAHPNGALLDMLDVDRVEVLRGPQGTLFGRNTAGGALRYFTAKPGPELAGNLKLTVGSFNRRDVSGSLNMPFSDTWALRFAVSDKSRDGYIHRVVDGLRTGDENSQVARAQLRWQASDKLDFLLAADRIRTHDHGNGTTIGGYSPTDLYPGLLYNAMAPPTAVALRATTPSNITTFAPGTAAADFARFTVTDRYSVYGGSVDINEFRSSSVSLTINYAFNDNLSLKSITGSSSNHQRMTQDWDRTPINMFLLNEFIDMEYTTQELQLTGNYDRLKWVAGLYYFKDDAFDDKFRDSPTDGVRGREFKDLITKSRAAFAQATYNFTDRFSGTLGLRYSKDTKDYVNFRSTRNIIAGVPTPFRAPQGEWTDTSPRVGLEQRWTPTIMTYVSFAKGYKAGGLNDTMVNSPGTTVCAPGTAAISGTNPANCGLTEFKPENLKNYEIGLRSEFFNRRLRLNLTAFESDYKDMQVQLIDQNPPPTQYNINADAKISGVELELAAVATDNFIIRASYGFTDARYGPNIAAQTIPPPPRLQVPTLGRSTPLLRAPKNSYNIALAWKQPLANGNELRFDTNYGHKSEQASTSTPTNMILMPAYGLLNARLEYRTESNWSIALYGTNLTDEYYLTSAMDPAGPASKFTFGSGQSHDAVFGFTMLDVGRPREYGIEVGYKF